jgi:kynurenine formamidase
LVKPTASTRRSSIKYFKASNPQPGACCCPFESLFSKQHAPGWGLDALKYLIEERRVEAVGHETFDTDASVDGQRFDQSVRSATKVPGSIVPCSFSHASICARVTMVKTLA